MRWISKRQAETKRLTQRALKTRRRGLAGLFSVAAIAALCGCCFAAAHAQQPQAQTGTQSATTPPSITLQAQPILQPTAAAPTIPSSIQARSGELRFLVLLDAAHGGADMGAMLDPATPEKNYTLGLVMQLRAALNAHGIRSTLTRASDVAMSNDARATIANRSHASACISLHATSTGNGVHLFTSSLPAMTESDPRRAFLPWQTAQAAYETSSLRLESDVDAAMTQQHIPVLVARTSILPLDSMACPAIDVEVAPLDASTTLSNADYHTRIVNALDAAMIAWRNDWGQQP